MLAKRKNSSRVCHFLLEGYKRGYCKLRGQNMKTKYKLVAENKTSNLKYPYNNEIRNNKGRTVSFSVYCLDFPLHRCNSVNNNNHLFSQLCQVNPKKQTNPICITRFSMPASWPHVSHLDHVIGVKYCMARIPAGLGSVSGEISLTGSLSLLSVRKRRGAGFCRR